MKAVWFWYCHEAFGSVAKQVHIKLEGDPHLYRIFGEGEDRYVRRVVTATRQSKVMSKRMISQILALADIAEHSGARGECSIEV